MSALLQSHLSQINLCATSIADLPFPGPKIFTRALLSPSHDITALIRDTEQHERALFHLAPPPLPAAKSLGGTGGAAGFGRESTVAGAGAATGGGRRATQYASARQPRNKAVAAVLGGDLYLKTRGAEGEQGRRGAAGDMDVEVLLLGAEKLAGVYPIPGASEKITALRRRHQQLEANLAYYETRVAEQTRELQEMGRPKALQGTRDSEDAGGQAEVEAALTREDLEREEEEVRELERKKRGLEERVEGMERDLGGLMR